SCARRCPLATVCIACVRAPARFQFAGRPYFHSCSRHPTAVVDPAKTQTQDHFELCGGFGGARPGPPGLLFERYREAVDLGFQNPSWSMTPFSADPRRSPVFRYSIAVIATLLAALVRLSLAPVLGDSLPLVTFILAVLAASWLGGLGP